MVSSSRSTRLRPSWLPSVVATRLATGMKSDDAGILSSARSRLANLSSGTFLRVFAVDGRVDLADGGCLQLFATPLGGGDSILDRLADRVVRVGHRHTRALCRLLGSLYGLARAQLDRLAADAVHLAAPRARRDVSAGSESHDASEDEPAETAATTTAAAAFLI